MRSCHKRSRGPTGSRGPTCGSDLTRVASGLAIGTTLVREWNGERIEVLVAADGFEFRGERYSSLSAIARKVSGTQWNGPLFFGLRKRAKK